MTTRITAAKVAAALALVPAVAWAQSGTQDSNRVAAIQPSNLDTQISKIEGLSEITDITVVTLHAAGGDTAETSGDDGEETDAATMSDEELLLSGTGERRIMTGADDDESAQGDTAASANGDMAATEESAGDTVPDDTPSEFTPADDASADDEQDGATAGAAASATGGSSSGLQAAIEGNQLLADALAERDVALESVVGVEIRTGTSVIVYTDESRDG